MNAPMTPDRVRTDALQPGDRVWHPYDMVRFTVGGAPEELDQPLTFHNRATDEMEPGMRVTGTDDRGDAVHVDTAPSYLWHRDVEQPTAPAEEPPRDTSLTPEREQEIRTLDLLELMSDRVAPVISGHLAALLTEVDHLRDRVEELVAQRDDTLVELVTGQAPPEAMSPWERAVAGLNALVDADVIFHVEPDGHISAPFSDEHIEWDLKARRWILTHDEDEDSYEQSVAEYLSTPYTDDTTPAPTEAPHDSPLHHTDEHPRDLARSKRSASAYLRSSTGILHLRRSGPEDDGLSYHYARCGWYADLGREAVPLAISAPPNVCKRCEVIEP